MTKQLLYLITALLISCTQQKTNTEAADSLKTKTITRDTTKDTATNSNPASEEDCVFNNDYKGLTSDWLAELKIKKFIWREDLKQALVPKGQDTVFVSQGGCSHSGFSVELKLTNDNHSLADSAYWIKKALDIAIEYQMDHYERMIKEGKIKKADSRRTSAWYEIDDNDIEDNLIYNGIEITLDGQDRRVSISQYFN
jgi:hypothetical protein